MYSELELINTLVFKRCGLELANVEAESESQEYFAHNFLLDGQKVKFRTAKMTPVKTGKFVTIWKRDDKGSTIPFDIADDIDLYIIAARQNENFGLFIFTKTVLHEKKILSDNAREGKRGIRVYPTWDLTTSKQAQKTQLWQRKYFLEINQGNRVEVATAKKLLSLKKNSKKI